MHLKVADAKLRLCLLSGTLLIRFFLGDKGDKYMSARKGKAHKRNGKLPRLSRQDARSILLSCHFEETCTVGDHRRYVRSDGKIIQLPVGGGGDTAHVTVKKLFRWGLLDEKLYPKENKKKKRKPRP